MSLWVDKYKPTNINNIIGNSIHVKKCELWLNNFIKKKENTPKCLLITGPPGIGKTTTAYLLLKKYKFDILEFNASDIRNQKLVKEKFNLILGKQSISSLMGGNKYNGIIMDEVDGLSQGDKGGLKELINYINPKKTKKNIFTNPIICICNNDNLKKIKELKKYSNHIVFNLPKINEIYDYLKKINQKEKIFLNDDYLLKIVNHSQKDIRKMISIIELFSKKKNENIDLFLQNLDKKNINIELYQSVFNILNSYTGINNIYNIYYDNKNLINLLIHHNILGFLENYKTNNLQKLETIELIYKAFCESDYYDSKLFNEHNYDIVQYNGIIKCCYVSFLLNKHKKEKYLKFNVNNLEFSNLLNKFSSNLYNYKTKYNLMFKINVKSSHINNDEIFDILIINIIKNYNNYKINKIIDPKFINFLKNCKIDINDLEKILKILKNKYMKTKKEKYFNTLSNTNLDKKYFIKFLKLI